MSWLIEAVLDEGLNPFKKKYDYTYEEIKSKAKFDELYKKEAYCKEGLNVSADRVQEVLDYFMKKFKYPSKKIKAYWCTGKTINNIYHLTGDNKYPEKDYRFFFIDWQDFDDKKFNAAENKGNFRYFSDVVDNNARREIKKHNKFYDDYHSLYGDDWFKSTL